METLRQRLSIFIFSTLFAACAFAQSTLTHIQDTVYTPSGTLFNGTVVITWLGPGTPTGSNPAPYNTSVEIYNGALSVYLLPSTTATPPANYQAVYNSSDGLVTWTETWQVPPSSTPLTLSEVRVSGGTTTGTSTGSSTTPIAIAQVTGLSSFLSALNSSVNSLTAMVNALNSSVTSISNALANLTAEVNNIAVGTTNALFQDAETPSGTENGTNATFALSYTPVTAASLMLFKNGVLQANGSDYSLSGSTVTFTSNAIPQSGDVLQAFYRIPGAGQLSTFVDDDIPQGTIDGNNLTFTLGAQPTPALSLKLFKNGILLQQNTDYTLNGATITFASTSVTPQPGDTLCAYYRTPTPQASPEIFANRGAVGPAHRDR